MKPTETNLEDLLKNFAMVRAMQAKVSSKYLVEYQLSPNELDVLILLSNNQTIDTAKELTIYLGVSKGLICRSIDHLVEKGYLQVQEDKKDHRMQRLRLDKNAQPIIMEIKKARSVIANRLLSEISEDELYVMNKVFHQIKENFEKLEEETI